VSSPDPPVNSPDPPVKEYADALADGIEDALPGWVEACVTRVTVAATGSPPDREVAASATAAGAMARQEVGPQVRALLAQDVDEQITTPLAIVRSAAVRYPTDVLRAAGLAAVARDAFAERAFPADIYDLSPASFADLSPDLVEVGMAWGAAKAFVHRRRHGS
jgi:hypothetical protein